MAIIGDCLCFGALGFRVLGSEWQLLGIAGERCSGFWALGCTCLNGNSWGMLVLLGFGL